MEGLQFDLGEGPQWEVMKTGMPILSVGLSPRATEHWPVFGTAAAGLAAAALFAFPIAMGATTVGDLYRRPVRECIDPLTTGTMVSVADIEASAEE